MIREPGPHKGCHYISHIQEPDFIIGLQLISPCLSIAYCLWEILPSLNPISAETSHVHGTISMCPSYIRKLYIFSRECRGRSPPAGGGCPTSFPSFSLAAADSMNRIPG